MQTARDKVCALNRLPILNEENTDKGVTVTINDLGDIRFEEGTM